MSNVCAVFIAILFAAFDEFGEKTSHHLLFPIAVRLGGTVGSGGNVKLDRLGRTVILSGNVLDGSNVSVRVLRGNVRLGGNVDASKLSHVVGSSTNLELTNARMPSRTSAKRAGMMIWNVVTTMRRFCSSQFFHSNSQNCARFEIAILMLNTALKHINTFYSVTNSDSVIYCRHGYVP